MAWHVGDMAYKICLEWFCPQSPECGVELLCPSAYTCVHHTIFCTSALSERFLRKDCVLRFSHFLLEVMPVLCVLIPHFLTKIILEVLPLELGVCLASILTII